MALHPARRDHCFQHEKLKLGGNSIRLITLRPGDEGSPLECDITQYAIHRRPEYVALSYSWGADGENWPIILNGKRFLVRRNLFDCLRRLRQNHREPLTLWIDALCIDQTDVKERNHIVQLMDQVYERSKTVYVWLGEGDEDSDRAMQFLADIDVSSQPKENAVDWFLDTFMSPVEYYQEWVAVIRLFKRPYWSRLWVIQETLLAPSINVFCGQHRLDWKQMEAVVMLGNSSLSWYAKRRPDRASIHSAILNTIAVRMVARRRYSVQFKGKRDSYPTLQVLLESFKDAECFDARDEIFGLLSIAGDYYNKRVDYIDYDMRPAQVFMNFVRNYVDPPAVPWTGNICPVYMRRDRGDPLWNIRRLSDALRLNIDNIMRSRRESFEAGESFSTLAENPHESVLTLPCEILYKFIDSGEEVEDADPYCVLRSSLGVFSSNTWSTADSESLSPSITVYEPPEAQTRLKELAETEGYKICNTSIESSRLNTPVLKKPYVNTSFRYFNRFGDNEDDHYVPHLFGITCPTARSGDLLVKTEESALAFIARRDSNGTYHVIGNAIMREDISSRLKIISSAHKIWHYHSSHHHSHTHHTPGHHHEHGHHTRLHIHHRHGHDRRHAQPLDPLSITESSSAIQVQFPPLILLMIVNEPTFRLDKILPPSSTLNLDLDLDLDLPLRSSPSPSISHYTAPQPHGPDDPVIEKFGTKMFTASAHLNRLANQIRDRTAVALEGLREIRHDLREG